MAEESLLHEHLCHSGDWRLWLRSAFGIPMTNGCRIFLKKSRTVTASSKAVEDTVNIVRRKNKQQSSGRCAPRSQFWQIINSDGLNVKHKYKPLQWKKKLIRRGVAHVLLDHVFEANSLRGTGELKTRIDKINKGGSKPPWATNNPTRFAQQAADMHLYLGRVCYIESKSFQQG